MSPSIYYHHALLYIMAFESSDEQHSRYAKRFYNSLSTEERRKRAERYPRKSLFLPHSSQWRKFFMSHDDQTYITLTGLDVKSFKIVCKKFADFFDCLTPFDKDTPNITQKVIKNRGRPRNVRPEDCLALCLGWTRTRGSNATLQAIFGMTMTNLITYLKFGQWVLVNIMRDDPKSAVRMPNDEQMEGYLQAIAQKHALLGEHRVWASMDGLKLTIQRAPNNTVQRSYYCGWTHDHFVTNIFVFAPDGTISICFYNARGNMHDSLVASFGEVYKKLAVLYQKYNVKVACDAAFGAVKHPFILKSHRPKNARWSLHRERLHTEVVKMRQSAEWGMRALQSSFPRLKDRIIYEEMGNRKIMLKLCILFFNYRARLVGINQIRNFYMPHLKNDANHLAPKMKTESNSNNVRKVGVV